MAEGSTNHERKRLQAAFKVITILVTLLVGTSITAIWLWRERAARNVSKQTVGTVIQLQENFVQQTYPNVDFTKVYPGVPASEIDQIQRETSSIRLVYAPFIQFQPRSVKGRFVEVTKSGFRRGRSASQPWPPSLDALTVFVFGGSTTFGYGVPNDGTIAVALQDELKALYPTRSLECYNFGRNFYFSSQERVLFESLLLEGITPDVAIFIDGYNDFIYSTGEPELTGFLRKSVAPDLPVPAPEEIIASHEELVTAIDKVLAHYQQNKRIIESIADRYGVKVIFVGQPVPYHDFPRHKETFPFGPSRGDWQLGVYGYPRFKEWADTGKFGRSFLWCGDAFRDETRIMYVDQVHYSCLGSKVLARAIVRKAHDRGLLP